jgi:RNA polymerase sigma factor (sigma-70 family)
MSVQAPETVYERDRDYVLGVLGRRCGWLDPSDREAVFHDAYMVMLDKQRGGELDPESMHPQQLRAYLTQTAIYKALDEGKRAENQRTEAIGEEIVARPDPGPGPDDLAASAMDKDRVREIVSELSERGQAIVKMRFFFDRTPDEIQRLLSISPRAYRRELERAMRHVSERYEQVLEGSFCESRRSLVLAYVAGIAGPNRAREAREHIASCPGCAHLALEVREAARRVAGVLPPVVLFKWTAPAVRSGEVLGWARDRAADLFTTSKQHAGALLARGDGFMPYAGAARPGPLLATVAGCLAIGSGATYCVINGVPTPGGDHDKTRTPLVKEGHPHPAKRIGQPTPQPPPRRPEPRHSSPRVPATPQAAAANEFGLEGSASGSASPPSPPPAPPDEFSP